MIYEQQTIDLLTNAAMSADQTSAWFDVTGFTCGGMVIDWTGANATTALVIPQFSVDLECWCNYVAEANAQRVDAATGCKMYAFPDFCFKYIRLRFLKKSNSTGALRVKLFVKRTHWQNR